MPSFGRAGQGGNIFLNWIKAVSHSFDFFSNNDVKVVWLFFFITFANDSFNTISRSIP